MTTVQSMWEDPEVDFDSILDQLGVKTSNPSTNMEFNIYPVGQASYMVSSPQHVPGIGTGTGIGTGIGSMKVVLDEERHIFRHAKEVQTGSRGGYLKGYIELPPDIKNKTIKLELSVVPSMSELTIHPHLLHLTVFGESQKKASYKTPLKNPSDWRLNFVIENGTRVYHQPNYGPAKVQLPDNCLETQGGKLRLVLGSNKILINIISSLQGGTKKNDQEVEGSGITNMDVIERRVAEELWQYPELQNRGPTLAKVESQKYTSKDFKIELHRCRLRACIFDGNVKTQQAISDVISNARDKNVGYLNLRSISDPGCCCTQGGWRFFLISEHKLARDKAMNKQDCDEENNERSPPVVPVLVITDKEGNIVQVDPTLALTQINTDSDSFEVHGDTFSIIIPPQNPMVINRIKNQGHEIRIFLYRCLDKKYSNSSVKFNYLIHNDFEDNCPFCLIKSAMVSPQEVPSGSKSRKRPKFSSGGSRPHRDSTQFSPAASPYSDITSSGISSPSSSIASPQYIPNNINDQLTFNIPNPEVYEVIYSPEQTDQQFVHSNSNLSLENHPMTWSNNAMFPNMEEQPDNQNNCQQVEDLSSIDFENLIFNFGSEFMSSPENQPVTDSCSGGDKSGFKAKAKESSNEVDVDGEVAAVQTRLEKLDIVKTSKLEKIEGTKERKQKPESDKPDLIKACSEISARLKNEPAKPVPLNIPPLESSCELNSHDVGLSVFFLVFAFVLYYYGITFWI